MNNQLKKKQKVSFLLEENDRRNFQRGECLFLEQKIYFKINQAISVIFEWTKLTVILFQQSERLFLKQKHKSKGN